MVQQRRTGFTTVELMVVLCVAATLATLAFPSFVTLIRTNRLDVSGELLRADLLVARREAIKMNGRVLVCPAGSSPTACGTDYSRWAGGWLVCYDLDGDGACDAATAAAPNPILRRGGLDGSLTLSGPDAAVRFNANGTQGNGGNVTFTVRGNWSGSTAAVGTIAASGNVALARGA